MIVLPQSAKQDRNRVILHCCSICAHGGFKFVLLRLKLRRLLLSYCAIAAASTIPNKGFIFCPLKLFCIYQTQIRFFGLSKKGYFSKYNSFTTQSPRFQCTVSFLLSSSELVSHLQFVKNSGIALDPPF